jgi:hypothetical protein
MPVTQKSLCQFLQVRGSACEISIARERQVGTDRQVTGLGGGGDGLKRTQGFSAQFNPQ